MTDSFRFIHAADMHLDSPFRGLERAPEQLRELLTDSTFSAMRQLTQTAIREQVDFILLSGDLFDEADRSLKAQLALVKEWELLHEHGIAVFVIHGNHDPLNGARAHMRLPSNVYVFGAEQMEYRPAYRRSGELAAFVYGRSYGTRAVMENIAASYRVVPEAPFHIAMLHGSVDGAEGHDPYAPCALSELVGAKGFDYWALGHIHSRRVLHEYPHVVYAGNTQGRHPKESGAKGCYIVDVSAAREVQLRFVPLDAVRWLDCIVPIDTAFSEQELLQQLNEAADRTAEAAEGRPVMLRIYLSGRGRLYQPLTDRSVVTALLEQLQEGRMDGSEESWVYVYRIEVNTSPAIRWEELETEDSFAGELLRLSLRLEKDERQWRELALEAVGPLMQHTKLSRVLGAELEELPERWLKQGRELALGMLESDET